MSVFVLEEFPIKEWGIGAPEVVGVFYSHEAAEQMAGEWSCFKFQITKFDIDVKEPQRQGIKYARDRLIAAYLNGSIDKSESEVRNIAKMLDGAAEQLRQEISDCWIRDDFGDKWLCGEKQKTIDKHGVTSAIRDVLTEMNRQDEKWGADRNLSPFVWQAILSEEVGEFAQAILHDEYGGEHAGTARAEMVQVAAVALQVIEMYDRVQEDKQ
ncbi:MazG-like family protein [Xenorhabdus sp. Sc-CR9]|uniref:MazG-like family protein n=1 Tax=Xenorhabdus sp. Sc-CR9 TaxID=2584468 RepID=UPI001F3A914C|nr:MazG-like family protein [Xenorhabdus sp. Sc-CR9]